MSASRLLSRPIRADAPPARAATAVNEQVTDPRHAARLLKLLAGNRSLVSVSVGGDATRYTSAILEVDVDGNRLELDELTPAQGHRKVTRGCALRVAGRTAGARIRFQVRVRAIEQRAGIALYSAALPAELTYRQQRASHRPAVKLAKPVDVFLITPGGRFVRGRLSDISLGGVAVEVGEHAHLVRGDRLPGCTVLLPGGHKVESALEVRHVSRRAGPADRAALVGGRFIDLDRKHERSIRRFVAALDREWAKQRARRD